MFEGVVVRAVVAVAVTVVTAGLVPAVNGHGDGGAQDRPAPPQDQPAPPPDRPAPRWAEEPEADRAGAAPRGAVELGVADDGMRWGMEHRDPSNGTSGSAGISMTDEGFSLHLHSDGPEGAGGAEVSMTDDGMVLRFDVDESE